MHIPERLATKFLVASVAATATAGLGLAGTAFATTGPSITTVAGNGTAGFSGDGGPAVKAQLNFPTGVAEDPTGALYIGDTINNRVRKVVSPTANNSDIITTLAGNGTAGFSGDGGPAIAAKLSSPTGVAVDGSGNVYIADTGNNRVREVSAAGIIKTIAGTGTCSAKTGDGGVATSASLCGPTGIAVDGAGNVFVSDTGHNEVRIIQVHDGMKIQPIAGTGKAGSSGDGGPALRAQLHSPTGIAMSANEVLYIADTGNTYVRMVNQGGVITAFAGKAGNAGFGGDGGPATAAKLNSPTGVGLDPLGDVFISDTNNNRIRKVATSLTITTYAGTGAAGYSGDGSDATAAELNHPTGQVASDGNALYFSDTLNQRVRGVFTGPAPVLPDSTLAIALPLTAVAVIGGAGGIFWLRRRRHALAS